VEGFPRGKDFDGFGLGKSSSVAVASTNGVLRSGPESTIYTPVPVTRRFCLESTGRQLTRPAAPSTVKVCLMSVSKIQVGQLWKKDGTGETYLVTRLYSEALNTMVILRKSGAEDQAQIRVKVERAAAGQKIPGFSPAQEDEKF
jgi:hypothetical protein